LSNEQLVELAQSKHEIAFNIMLKRHKGLVYYKARGYFHSGVEFDDILQEGSIGLYRAISDYTKGHNMSFMSFAEMCIKRNIINYLRGLNRLKHTFLNEYISFETSIGNHLDDLTYINILSNEDQ